MVTEYPKGGAQRPPGKAPAPPSTCDGRAATRIAFLASGFGLSCWAPLVPLAKDRLGIGDGALGFLLLCLGLGSVAAMQLAGPLISRVGARPAVLFGGLGQAIALPFIAIAPTIPTMAAALLAFGAFLGAIDVGMNVHAVEVEKRASRPLMSGFHGLFSIGSFAGSVWMTAALSMNLAPLLGAAGATSVMATGVLYAAPKLIATPKSDHVPLFVVPRGPVRLLAILTAIAFLVEGAILDWGALLLSGKGLMPIGQAGLGYSVFALAMTIGRLSGDAVVARLGDRHTLVYGGLLAILGQMILLVVPLNLIALFGFLLVGLGASNTVPVLFRRAGTQTVMPPGLAIAAVTTVGYAGILAGPAGMGILAQAIGLPGAFWLLTLVLCLVPLAAKRATAS